MIKRLAVILSLATIAAIHASADSATVAIDAGLLTDQNGNPISNGSGNIQNADLVLLLVSPTGVFGPTVGNEFVSGNDLIVASGTSSTGSVTGAFSMNTATSNTAGETATSLQFDLGEGATGASASTIVTNSSIVAGDKLAIRWYTNFTLAQFAAGQTPTTGYYGTYTTTAVAPNDDGGSDWVVPAGGSNVDLNFFTVSDGGDQANILGEALTPVGSGSVAVPEPSTYALAFAGFLLFVGMAARKKVLARVSK